MSTPCCASRQRSELLKTLLRPTTLRLHYAYRIKHAAQGLELRLHVFLLALQLREGELGGAAIGGARSRGARGHGGCVEVAHSQR